MRLQVFILLSLMCYTAFSDFAKYYGAGTAGNGFALGVDETGICQIQNSASDSFSYGVAGDCEPKGLFMIGSNLWVVLQVALATDILKDTNSATGNANVYDTRFLQADDDAPAADTVIIGRIDTSTGANFGKFHWAAYIAASNGAATPTLSGLVITETTSCQNIIQIRGNVAATFTLTNQAGAQAAGVTGNGVYLAFDTTGTSAYTYNGYTAAQCVVTPPAEDEEEEEEQEKSSAILSVTSAVLAMLGLFNL